MENVTVPEINEIRLTSLSKSSGCGCKLAPAALQEILKGNVSNKEFTDLLIGNENADDAALLKLNDEQGLLSTVDFFTPVVDDPFVWGQIAAANAISDIYAMGGQPVLATAILGWPLEKLGSEMASKVLQGARSKCSEAGIPLGGGHSIESPEPFFGLSVNGLVKLKAVKSNAGAKPGDLLFLTKPLGSGVLSSAIKKQLVTEDPYQEAILYMSSLNSFGKELQSYDEVHAMSDVTGFALLGHLVEICKASKCSATIEYAKLPLMKGVSELISKFCFPDNTYRNWNAIAENVEGIDASNFVALCDPQTNGGLLIAVDPTFEKEFKVLAKQNHIPENCLEPIGRVELPGAKTVTIQN